MMETYLMTDRSVLCVWRAARLRARVSSRVPVCPLFGFGPSVIVLSETLHLF